MLIIKNFAWIEFLPSPFHPNPICLLECFKIVSSIVNFQESWFKLVTMVTSIVGVAKSQSTNENFLVVKGWVQIFLLYILLFFLQMGFLSWFSIFLFFSFVNSIFSLYSMGMFSFYICVYSFVKLYSVVQSRFSIKMVMMVEIWVLRDLKAFKSFMISI